jgi:hypothetical protein
MTSRELVFNALRFEDCPRFPTDRHDTGGPMFLYGPGRTAGVPMNSIGARLDEWGVEWVAAEEGVTGEVRRPPIIEWQDLERFAPPWDVLDRADLATVDEQCRASDRFMIPMWWANYNLFERMQNLRGTENLLLDLADEEPDLYRMRDMIHSYFMRQGELWASTAVDGIHIADDWGSQTSLLVSPAIWRNIFKPCYKEYVDMAHAYGKKVVMHSDGFIAEILDDLVEIGVDAINAQLFCMDIEGLAERYHHKIAFWGEIDRQQVLPKGTPEDCRSAVRRVAGAFLRYGRTGVVGQAFSGKDIPEANLDAVYDEWTKISIQQST